MSMGYSFRKSVFVAASVVMLRIYMWAWMVRKCRKKFSI